MLIIENNKLQKIANCYAKVIVAVNYNLFNWKPIYLDMIIYIPI